MATAKTTWTKFYFLIRNSRRLGYMLLDILRGKYRPPRFVILTLGFCLAYVLLPFDLIPEFIPVLGWLDDGLIYYFTLQFLNKALQNYTEQTEKRKHEHAVQK